MNTDETDQITEFELVSDPCESGSSVSSVVGCFCHLPKPVPLGITDIEARNVAKESAAPAEAAQIAGRRKLNPNGRPDHQKVSHLIAPGQYLRGSIREQRFLKGFKQTSQRSFTS